MSPTYGCPTSVLALVITRADAPSSFAIALFPIRSFEISATII